MRWLSADLVTHHHHPLDCLAAGRELGLAQDRRGAASGVATITTTLPFGFQPGRAVDALNLVVAGRGLVLGAGRPLVHHGVRRVVRQWALGVTVGVVAGAGLAPTTASSASSPDAASDLAPFSPPSAPFCSPRPRPRPRRPRRRRRLAGRSAC